MSGTKRAKARALREELTSHGFAKGPHKELYGQFQRSKAFPDAHCPKMDPLRPDQELRYTTPLNPDPIPRKLRTKAMRRKMKAQA